MWLGVFSVKGRLPSICLRVFTWLFIYRSLNRPTYSLGFDALSSVHPRLPIGE